MTSPTSTSAPTASPRTPYADACEDYYQAGWRGILPLPAGRKAPVPVGYTGNHGAWPSWPDVLTWADERPEANVALRLPENIIGVDVDAYGSKPGGLVLDELEKTLGALPATWRSTSRDDGRSGIRLFRVPEGLAWPNIFGPGIESIRHGHRYVVAPPSLHPETQRAYRWIDPDGNVALTVPDLEQLPEMPEAWVMHFTGGQMAGGGDAKADLDDEQVIAWIDRYGIGEPCRAMTKHLAAIGQHTGSRHDHYLQLTNAALWLAGEGHPGAGTVIAQARAAFLAATAGERAAGEAEREWARMITGGIAISAAKHPDVPDADPCTDPFAGLIDKDASPWNQRSALDVRAQESSPSPSASNATAPATSLDSDAPTATEGQTSEADHQRTTWWPIDIEGVITGTRPRVEPTMLLRDDEAPAFYPARVNGIIGPSESGKTWVALAGVVQAVEDGQNATILDFEDDEDGVVGRLLALGASPAALRQHLAYIAPGEALAPHLATGADLLEHLDATEPSLVLVDGFNAAMGLQGLDLMSNGDATRFFQTVLRPLADRGACVVYVDHTPKNSTESAGGIGAQAKRAMTSGCILKVDVVKPFGKGQEGKVRLYVDKDRPGGVRGISAQSKTGHWYADVNISSSGDESVDVAIRRPEGMGDDGHVTFRPTVLMGRISDWLADNPGAGRNDVLRAVTGDASSLRKALQTLVDERWVRVEHVGQKHLHHLETPFSEILPAPNQVNRGGGVEPGLNRGSQPQAEINRGGGVEPGYVVPGSSNPGGRDRRNLVERTIGGQRVMLNLATGETLPVEDER